MIFVQKVGKITTRAMRDTEESVSKITVKGITQWTRIRKRYQHPIAFVGAGHNGLRMAVHMNQIGYTDLCLFDPHGRVGGRAWVANANTTSKLQTEFAVYHLDY